MDNRIKLSVTPTVGKQTANREFGEVLGDAMVSTANTVAHVSGALMNSIPGVSIVSAAVSSVTSFANASPGGNRAVSSAQSAATGITTIGGSPGSVATVAPNQTGSAAPDGMGNMMSQMRAEADRSIMIQMQMQNESREYNTLSNVIKTRHDSAKAAINNIR